jgi:hypothetical protein
LRDSLTKSGLENQESKKYTATTYHCSLLKFLQKPEVQKLLDLAKILENLEIGDFEVNSLVLNISPRYDKTQTINILENYSV